MDEDTNREQKRERDFKGIWIPKQVYLHKDLCWTEKILFVEIDSLDNEKGCFASNEYFADFIGVGIRRISEAISKLKKIGLIYQESFDGRTRVLHSKNINCEAGSKQVAKQTGSKVRGRQAEKCQHNNTVNNTKNKRESEPVKQSLSPDSSVNQETTVLTNKQESHSESANLDSATKLKPVWGDKSPVPKSVYHNYKSFCKYMQAFQLKDKPVDEWTEKDFIVYFYCAKAKIESKNISSSKDELHLTLPTKSGAEYGKMKQLINSNGKQRLKDIIRTMAEKDQLIFDKLKRRENVVVSSLVGDNIVKQKILEVMKEENDKKVEKKSSYEEQQEIEKRIAEITLEKRNSPEAIKQMELLLSRKSVTCHWMSRMKLGAPLMNS